VAAEPVAEEAAAAAAAEEAAAAVAVAVAALCPPRLFSLGLLPPIRK
jgi:hypothetical protein